MEQEKPYWFVLNYICQSLSKKSVASAIVDKFNSNTDASLDLFAPTFVSVSKHNGKVSRQELPLTYHYVFVRGMLDDIKKLCAMDNGFSFVLNHGGDFRYLTVTDADMESFKLIAGVYANALPCFMTSEVALEEGDLVQVIDGDFAGLTGTYVAKRGGRNGKLMISVSQKCAVVVYDIRAEYVRILRFADGARRAYDLIDAFVPVLLKAMRVYNDGRKLEPTEVARLTVFCKRMGEAQLGNMKLYGKLQVLLMGASRILGDEPLFQRSCAAFEHSVCYMTNPWTRALVLLIQGIIYSDASAIKSGYDLIAINTPASMFQNQLLNEYNYYIKDK